MRKLYQGLF